MNLRLATSKTDCQQEDAFNTRWDHIHTLGVHAFYEWSDRSTKGMTYSDGFSSSNYHCARPDNQEEYKPCFWKQGKDYYCVFPSKNYKNE